MKRAVLVLFALLTLSCAQAQDLYFGLRVDVVADISENVVVPLPGLQLGFHVLDNVELRGSLATLLFVNFFQVDVLYTQN